MKMMYIVYSADKKPLGIFKDRKSRDIKLKRCGGSYKSVNIRSVKRAYKGVKGCDILMTAKELAKLMDCVGNSEHSDSAFESEINTFMDKYGNKKNISTYNDMMTDLVKITDNERYNSFAQEFETAVSLILSRELI